MANYLLTPDQIADIASAIQQASPDPVLQELVTALESKELEVRRRGMGNVSITLSTE